MVKSSDTHNTAWRRGCDNFVMSPEYHVVMATEDESTTRYVSYMLRLRRIWDDDQPIWTGSLEDNATGSHRSFPNVETLAAFLLAEFGRRQPVAKDDA